MKICNKCEQPRELVEFSKNCHSADGRTTICKKCFTEHYYRPNKDKYAKRREKWKNKNLEHLRELDRQYFQKPNRKLKHKINQAQRRAVQMKATIPGFESQVREIYEKCPPGMHVDHVVPLRGKTVCGLHVPWNLQYLTPEENQKKKNKLIL